MSAKRIVVIGAGPGGVTAAMILANRGHQVTVFEQKDTVGGRNAAIQLGPYTFDIGPTFLMMTFLLREVFEAAGRQAQDYLDIRALDPMYQLSFKDKVLRPTTDRERMRAQIESLFPGNGIGLDKFHAVEAVRYDRMYPCLKKAYSTAASMLLRPLLRALPHLSLGRSLYDVLGDYFSAEDLRISFTFQSKYLGMSPWQCPGAFGLIPYVEHAFGIDHVMGGLSMISEAMAKVAREHGADIRLNTRVKQVLVKGGEARGVLLTDGSVVDADAVVINADFGHAMETLFEPGIIRKYTPAKLRNKQYSCSTFMLYLGVDKLYDEPHHNVIFADNYKANIEDISRGAGPSDDMSVYVRNASMTDPSLAPNGQSAIYVLVPVANARSGINWTPELTREYCNKIIARIAARTSMKDLAAHIRQERIITPRIWNDDFNIFLGSTFNLGHTLSQMLYFRPRNRFEEVGHVYLVGGGTHPGSGLPTIYESARISSDLIEEQ
ncbi:MAG: phytoene desaturase family protein [Kiritimatiellia bacterium]